MQEMQELVCHCGRVNTFPINTDRDGNYVIVCKCGHEHCRVCNHGRITGIRWESRRGRRIFVKSTERRYTQQKLGRRDPFLARAWLSSARR